MRIAESYVAHPADKRAAILELLASRDLSAVLAASGYAYGRLIAVRIKSTYQNLLLVPMKTCLYIEPY